MKYMMAHIQGHSHINTTTVLECLWSSYPSCSEQRSCLDQLASESVEGSVRRHRQASPDTDQGVAPVSPPKDPGSHNDAVAVKFCRRFNTRVLCRSDLWQTTTVPLWDCFCCSLLFPLPINVPIIFVTENLRVLLALCWQRDSFSRDSNAWYRSELFSATETSKN